MFEKKLVLDTCVLIWLAGGTDDISKQTKQQIENASVVFVSSISAWEISLKEAQGLLTLPLEAEKWFCMALQNHNLTLVPLDIDILIAANRLPWLHRDPADRFIIATAIREKATVVTADKRFREYPVKVILDILS